MNPPEKAWPLFQGSLQSFLQAQLQAYRPMAPGKTPGAGVEPRDPIPPKFSCFIFLIYLYCGKIFKYKSKITVMNLYVTITQLL